MLQSFSDTKSNLGLGLWPGAWRGVRGQCPGHRVTGVVEKSQQCRKHFIQSPSSIQYIYSQKTFGSNSEAPNLFLAPGAI